jgi:hypothetical protein
MKRAEMIKTVARVNRNTLKNKLLAYSGVKEGLLLKYKEAKNKITPKMNSNNPKNRRR